MSNKALLIAIVVSLVVLCVVVVFVANGVMRANENVMLAKDLVAYCSSLGTKTVDECQVWTTDMLKMHRDKVVECQYDIPKCVAAAGLAP